MKKNVLVILFIYLITFFLNPVCGQNELTADDALILHKKSLWKNAREMDFKMFESGLQNEVDAVYYKLELEIQFNPDSLIGKVTGRFKSKTNNLQTLELDFADNMVVSTVSGPVSSYEHSGKKLTIHLSQSYSAGEYFEVTVIYSGLPDPGDRRWFVFDKLMDGSDHVWTLSEPFGARFWWPCKDTPADKADSADIIVTVPQNQVVASNGKLISDVINGNKRTFHWHEKYPIATYLVSLAVAPYAHFNEEYTLPNNQSMLLDFYVYPENESLAREIFPETKKHLDDLSSFYGPYPFEDEKYGLAQFGWRSGGMEHQTITSISRVSKDWEFVYVHELGHQWFGDALTCASWSDIWLNEGFASYSEALYAEKEGYNGLPAGMESYRAYINHQRYVGEGTINIQDTTNISQLFGNIVYNKGSWVLHMLRGILGDKDFFNALYSYANGSLRYKSVHTEDFKKVCEQVSGKDLDKFFEEWIYEPYYPKYFFSWEKYKSSNNNFPSVKVNIRQIQSGIIFEMPIELKFIFLSGNDTTVTINNYLQNQDYIIPLAAYPVEMILDPDNWILKEAYDQSGGSFSSQINIENIYPNPSNSDITIEVLFWGQTRLTVNIFDVNGRFISRLEPYSVSKLHRYYFKWNGANQYGKPVAAGVYFIQPVNKNYKTKNVRKVILLK